MTQVEPKAEEQSASPAALDKTRGVNGPSCPAAFAAWWAEYRSKLAKSESGDPPSLGIEGLQ